MPEMTARAAGSGHMRASHADREQVIDLLKATFVQGRLAKDEFDLRVGQALASRTVAELAALTADIPAAPAAARSPRLSGQGRAGKADRPGKPDRPGKADKAGKASSADRKVVTTLAFVTAGAMSLFALPYVVTVLTDGDRPHAQTVIFLVVMLTVFAMPLTAVLLKARFANHGGRPSAPYPRP